MVKSYDDPIKQKSREKLRDFIAKNLLTFRKPSQIKVVCFPGAEVEGEEALEVKQVYDSLGIPRENITGLEVDVEKAERLRKANLGIEVINSLDLDFFKNENRVFDIISLDYTGYRDASKWFTLSQIAGRQRLYGNGILATNYSANREQLDNQGQILSLQGCVDRKLFHRDAKMMKTEMDGVLNSLSELEEHKKKMDLTDLRNNLSYFTLEIMEAGRGAIFKSEILKSHPYYNQGMEILAKREKEILEKDPKMKYFLKNRINFSGEERLAHHLSYGYTTLQKELFFKYLHEQSNYNPLVACIIVEYLASMENKSYFYRACNRYFYTSNKNAIMHLDLFAFSSAERIFKRMNGKVFYNKDNATVTLVNIKERDIIDTYNNLLLPTTTDIPERIYLGSSWVHPKLKERISKEDAIELLRDGCSPSEIFDCYRGFTKKQLGAYRAHYVTMGKNVVN